MSTADLDRVERLAERGEGGVAAERTLRIKLRRLRGFR